MSIPLLRGWGEQWRDKLLPEHSLKFCRLPAGRFRTGYLDALGCDFFSDKVEKSTYLVGLYQVLRGGLRQSKSSQRLFYNCVPSSGWAPGMALQLWAEQPRP